MQHDLDAALHSLHQRFNRNAALAWGFGLLALCWSLAFLLENDLCLIAGAMCAFFCLHVASKAQAWRDAHWAAQQGICHDGLLKIQVVSKGEDYMCHASVLVAGIGRWEYPNIGRTIPHATAEHCRCYFKPGIAWPVLVVSDHDCVIPAHTPRWIADDAQHWEGAVQAG